MRPAVRIFFSTVLMLHALMFAPPASTQDKPGFEILTATGHSAVVSCVAFSPDGRYLVSGSGDKTLKLWETSTGRLLRTFKTSSDWILSVAFSPDGTQVASGSADKLVRLWEASSGRLLRTFQGHTTLKGYSSEEEARKSDTMYEVFVVFSPDGKRVLSGGSDGTLRLWDTNSGRLLRTFTGHSGAVRSLAFSPDGEQILSGGGEEVKLWRADSGTALRTWRTYNNDVVAFSPDGTRVVGGGAQKTELWDARSGRLLHSFSGSVPSVVAFSNDGSRMLSGSFDGTVSLLDPSSGKLVSAIKIAEDGSKALNLHSMTFSPDRRLLITGSQEKTLKLWDVVTGRLLRTFEGPSVSVHAAVFSPDGSHMLSGGDEAELKLWDSASGRLLRAFAGHPGGVNSVAFSPDGSRVLSGGNDNALKLWDVETGKLLQTFEGHSKPVSSVAFSRDGKRVLSASGEENLDESSDYTLKLWDAQGAQATSAEQTTSSKAAVVGRRLLRTLQESSRSMAIDSVTFSPDGKRVLSGGKDFKLRVWEAESGRLLRSFEARESEITSVAYSPDAKKVLSATNQAVNVWDINSGRLLATLEHPLWVYSAAFSPDGARILTGGEDHKIRLWETGSGRLLRTFEGHTGTVKSVAFSADGSRILSSSEDTTLRVWNIDTGELLVTVVVGRNDQWLAITPQGFFAASDKGADDMLSVVRGYEITSIQQVHQSLFNPDLVREALAGDPDGEVRQAAKSMNMEKILDSGSAPEVTLVGPGTDAPQADGLVVAQANITDAGGRIGRVEWRVNGVTVAVINRIPGTEKQRTVTQTIALEPGPNSIEVIAYNERNLLASPPASATVGWNAPAVPPRKLFVIAVGIDDYSDTLFPRLSFAVRDAKAFGIAMREAAARLYTDVDVTYVLDGDATAENLEGVIDSVGARMSPRDVFVFFAAAHGKSEEGRFHLIPQDYHSRSARFVPEGAIGQEQLQEWFANRIRARLGLILLDTCESGALVANRPSGVDAANAEAALGRLNDATGRPVLTAAAADRAALEGYQGHGVFTYALLDALVNGDTNNDGQIELSELVAHVQTLAPRLSRELGARRSGAVSQVQSRPAAAQLGNTAIASRFAHRGAVVIPSQDPNMGLGAAGRVKYAQKPRLGSHGEDFPVVRRLESLPAVSR